MIPAELPEADTAPEVRAVSRVSDDERMRRWRIVLGAVPDPDDLDRGGVGGNRPDSDIAGGSSDAPDGSGRQPGSAAGSATSVELEGNDARIDAALAAIYDSRPARRGGASRAGGLGRSAPSVVRWLGDIRRYFPTPVVQVLQRDAVERLGLRRLLLEPELLRAVEPDLHLVTLLVELNRLLPDETRATARAVVDAMVREIVGRLGSRTMQAVNGALSRAQRGRRPRPADIDWPHTIRANLHHYLPEQRTVIPQRLVGYGRRRHGLARDVIVAIDQSGSMADSVVYAAVFGAVLAQIPTLQTSIVAFDTAVADLTELAQHPVDLLFGVQLGGGTDIANALVYCSRLISRPTETIVVLVTDLFEGGNADSLRSRVAELVHAGVTVVVLLALSDEGTPAYDHAMAADLAVLGVASLACTPDAFPDLLAAALEGRDIARWANEHGMPTAQAF